MTIQRGSCKILGSPLISYHGEEYGDELLSQSNCAIQDDDYQLLLHFSALQGSGRKLNPYIHGLLSLKSTKIEVAHSLKIYLAHSGYLQKEKVQPRAFHLIMLKPRLHHISILPSFQTIIVPLYQGEYR